MWLGDYADYYYGKQIEGVVDKILNDGFYLKTSIGDKIVFPSAEKIININSHPPYTNLLIGYELV